MTYQQNSAINDMTTPRTRCPTHPGEILREDVIPALKLTRQDTAVLLGVPLDELTGVLDGTAPVTAEFAARIEAWLGVDHGGDAEFWLAMQAQYDLWQTHQPRRWRLNTPEQEAAIQRGIAQDPDAQEGTLEMFERMADRRRDFVGPPRPRKATS